MGLNILIELSWGLVEFTDQILLVLHLFLSVKLNFKCFYWDTCQIIVRNLVRRMLAQKTILRNFKIWARLMELVVGRKSLYINHFGGRKLFYFWYTCRLCYNIFGEDHLYLTCIFTELNIIFLYPSKSFCARKFFNQKFEHAQKCIARNVFVHIYKLFQIDFLFFNLYTKFKK